MHTLNPKKRLLTLAILGGLAGAMMTFSLQDKWAAYGNRSDAEATKDLTVVQTGAQGKYAKAWQKLKSESEAQIGDNNKRISKFKAQSARASGTFRAIYDKRVAELERRNIDLTSMLNDYWGDRGENGRSSSRMSTAVRMGHETVR